MQVPRRVVSTKIALPGEIFTAPQGNRGTHELPIHTTMSLAKTYFDQARGPAASLYFVIPLLLLYVCGELLSSDSGPIATLEAWPQHASASLGVGSWLALPVLTIAGLMYWSRRSRSRWNVPAYVVMGMWAECVLLAVVAMAILHGSVIGMPDFSTGTSEAVLADAAPTALRQWKIGVSVEEVLAVVKVGISDDVLFRLLMFPAAVWMLRRFQQSRQVCLAGAVIVTTVASVAMNHFGWYAGPNSSIPWSGCAIHTALLGILFAVRGFGITAGTHAIFLVATALSLVG